MTDQSNMPALPPRERPESCNPSHLTDDLDPVRLRARHDGWTRARQMGFIDALAACGCVTEAAARVGMSARSAYKLRARPEAVSFRDAWDAALDHAVERLSDAVFSRALNGVERPIFFQGEQVGCWRQYDERLALFLLSRRAPDRFGSWIDRREVRREQGDTGSALAEAMARVSEDADAAMAAAAREPDAPVEPAIDSAPERDPLPAPVFYTDRQADARAEVRERMPTADETDALIMEKLDAWDRNRAMEAARAAQAHGGGLGEEGEEGDPYADVCELPDGPEEGWPEDEQAEDDRHGDDGGQGPGTRPIR